MRELTLSDLILFVILTLVVARLTRLAFKDTIFDKPRKAFTTWLIDDAVEIKARKAGRFRKARKAGMRRRRAVPRYLRTKLAELVVCPYCVSAWFSAGVLFAHRHAVEPVPVPVWWWLSVWMGAIVVLEYTDGARAQPPKK